MMSRRNRSSYPHRRLASIVLLLCLALPFIGAHTAAAHSRTADATPPAAVHYHLVAVVTGGPAAGTGIEGGVSGMLDSTGVLTATAVTAMGQTAAITGTLQGGGSRPVKLIMANAGGTWSLTGAPNKAGVLAGSISAAGSSAPIGAWAMTPETSSHTYAFVAKVTAGPDTGSVVSGTLVTLVTSATATSFDATYYDDGGDVSTAEGRLANSNLELLLDIPHLGVAIGAAPQAVETILGVSYTTYSGSFAGPSKGDAGQWTASQTS
jgi:hypothetical protein